MGDENRSEETREVMPVLVPEMMGLDQVVRRDLEAISLVVGVEDRE